jgi:serine/threonine protein kinase
LLEQSPLDDRSTAMLAVHLLSALTALHRRGIAHLDVKPDNVIVSGGHPTLIDFGSARRLGSAQPAGRPVGTFGFAAPEMEACEPISAAMDVFGVGATLRRAQAAICVDVPEPDGAGHCRPGLSAGLDRLIDAMLAARAGDRPSVPAALDAVAELFDTDERPWPSWLSADRTFATR